MILLILNIIKNLFNIMHKSILFLLICSLIMLLSFGSSISILSNSLAIEEGMNSHMNNQDSSQIYEKFYKDDSFREAYYNYHKQHHQQEQQQQQQNQESRYNDNYDNNEKAYYNYNDNNNDKSKDNVIVKKINCNNINVNVNGLELDVFPSFLGEGLAAEAQEGSTDASSFAGNGDDSEINDFRFICINNNNNTVIGEVEEPVTPPGPPEPITASLTAKKQVFGCADFDGVIMGCNLPNDSPAWLDCNTNPAISGTIFCQSLPESIFDIEVLDDQNNQIQQFEGSVQGTTIQNLESGTYTVNEIIHPTMDNQLGENLSVAGACEFSLGFSGGGQVLNTTTNVLYSICFEYEDEQGNNCSTITLAAGESRTCTVKNYIGTAFNGP